MYSGKNTTAVEKTTMKMHKKKKTFSLSFLLFKLECFTFYVRSIDSFSDSQLLYVRSILNDKYFGLTFVLLTAMTSTLTYLI